MTKKDIKTDEQEILEDEEMSLDEIRDELENLFGGIVDLGDGQFILEFDDEDGTKSEEALMEEFFQKLQALGGDIKVTAIKADGTVETIDDIENVDLATFVSEIKEQNFIEDDVKEKLKGIHYHPNISKKIH